MPVLKIKTKDSWEEVAGFTPNSNNKLPVVTADDNGKILQVVDGVWTVTTLADSSVKTYIDEYISSALEGDY